MELHQLRYFKIVAETEHFTRAAEQLHISQPSLSKAISNLEKELGVQLFERDKRAVYLNDYGRVFLKRVDRILTEAEEAAEELRDMVGEGGGDVYIGSCNMFEAPSKIHTYTNQIFWNSPAIALHMYIMDTDQIEELLMSRKLNFGFSVTLPVHSEIEAIKLYSYQVGVVVSKNHRLAQRRTIHLSEMRDESFMCNNTAPDLRDSLYELCHRAGFQPKIIFEGESTELIGEAVAEGRGVAFISTDRHRWKQETRVGPADDRVVFLDTLDEFCKRTVYLFQLKGRYQSAAARTYREGLLQFFSEA